jgi:hypothetical protein
MKGHGPVFLLIIIMIFSTVIGGCGKIKEATETVKSVSKTLDAAKDIAKTAESAGKSIDSDAVPVELTEKNVRRYYSELSGLQEKYPDIEFLSPMTASVQAGMSDRDLEKIIEKESSLSFDEYTALSTALLKAMMESMAAGMSDEMLKAMEEGVAQMEEFDTSEMSEEQQQEFDAQLEEQRAALKKVQDQTASAEVQKRREELAMINSIREEYGF